MPATAGGSPGWLIGPLRPFGIGAAHGSDAGPAFYVGLWLALFLYAVVVARARDLSSRSAVTAIVGLNVLFLLAPPLLSQDVFSYIAYARLGALHGLDPYTHSPLAITHDAVFGFAGSRGANSAYGPAFTLISYSIAGLGVAAAYWLLKLLAMLGSLAVALLVWRGAGLLRQDPVRAAVAVALNPLVLVHVVSAAHNEALVVAVTLAGVYALLAGRPRGATALATLAASLKASAALVIPYLVLAARPRLRAVAVSVALTAAAVAAVALPLFGVHALDALGVLGSNQGRSSRMSFPYKTAEGLAALFGARRGELMTPVRIAYASAFAAVAAVTLWRTWRGADPVRMAAWATFALLIASAWLVPWYLLWLLPLAALAADRRLALATLALCGWALAIAVPRVYG